MKNEEILDAFCKSRKLVRKEGSSLQALMPFLLTDCVAHMYDNNIKTLRLAGKTKQLRNQWLEIAEKINAAFEAPYNGEQLKVLREKMAYFRSRMHLDMLITQEAILRLLDTDRELEQRKVVASCLLSEVLCWQSMEVWKHNFECVGIMDMYYLLNGLMNKIHWFVNSFYGKCRHVNINDDDNVQKAITVMSRRMIKWLYDDVLDNEEEQ